MKKSILIIISVFLIVTFTKAQSKDQYLSNFKSLLKEAESDFKNVLGKELESDSATKTTYYACTKGLSSSFEAICVNKGDNTTYFTCEYDYSKTPELIKANEILPGIIDNINAMVKSGKYKGRDFKNGRGEDVTEVKDLEGNYIIEIESKTDVTNKNNYLKITVYGKSWGKK